MKLKITTSFRLTLLIVLLLSAYTVLVGSIVSYHPVEAELIPGPIITNSCTQSGGYCVFYDPLGDDPDLSSCDNLGQNFNDCRTPILPLTNPPNFNYGYCCRVTPNIISPVGAHNECINHNCVVVSNPDNGTYGDECHNYVECGGGNGTPVTPIPPQENGGCIWIGSAGACYSDYEGDGVVPCSYDYQCPTQPIGNGHCLGHFCSDVGNGKPCQYNTECADNPSHPPTTVPQPPPTGPAPIPPPNPPPPPTMPH